MDSHEDHNKWIDAVGRGLLAFGQIEHAATIALRAFCRERIVEHLVNLNLDRKLEIVCALLSQHNTDDLNLLRSNFKQAQELLETRNLIAHNPLVLDLYRQKDGDIFVEGRIRSLRRAEKHLTLVQTQEFANKAQELGAALVRESMIKGVAFLSGHKA